MLDWLQDDLRHAMRTGYSANLVVHAFARTARSVGIDQTIVDPFFDSMRMDLETTVHTRESFDRYVHGSAEVVGLMCLRVFVTDAPPVPAGIDLEHGARRLGAAFQKLNFLRDLGEDHDVLGRSYFPGLEVAAFGNARRYCQSSRVAAAGRGWPDGGGWGAGAARGSSPSRVQAGSATPSPLYSRSTRRKSGAGPARPPTRRIHSGQHAASTKPAKIDV